MVTQPLLSIKHQLSPQLQSITTCWQLPNYTNVVTYDRHIHVIIHESRIHRSYVHEPIMSIMHNRCTTMPQQKYYCSLPFTGKGISWASSLSSAEAMFSSDPTNLKYQCNTSKFLLHLSTYAQYSFYDISQKQLTALEVTEIQHYGKQ